jgi:hypothetical protein
MKKSEKVSNTETQVKSAEEIKWLAASGGGAISC